MPAPAAMARPGSGLTRTDGSRPAGARGVMGMRRQSRGPPQENRRADTRSRRQRRQTVELVEGIDDDASDAGGESGRQFRLAFVVAMEHEAIGWHAGGESNVQLA